MYKIAKSDIDCDYPRICAHRGFSAVAPENSLPSFALAVGMGADEIEFDLWRTTDGAIVSCHDATLERVSTGSGKIYEKSFDQIKDLDFGVKFSESFRGLRILTFEQILQRFAKTCIMNIHIKDTVYPDEYIDELVALLEKYDCLSYAYFMSGDDATIKKIKQKYPAMTCCMGAGAKPWEIVDRAIEYGCEKVQLFKPYFDENMIKKAHDNNIKCNVFWSDDEIEAKRFLDMGIDCILTNDYFKISQIIK